MTHQQHLLHIISVFKNSFIYYLKTDSIHSHDVKLKGYTVTSFPKISWFPATLPTLCTFPDPWLCSIGVSCYHQVSGSPSRCFSLTHTHACTHSANTHVTLWNVFVSCLLFFLFSVYLGNHCLSVVKEILYSFFRAAQCYTIRIDHDVT